jgi:small-conductance mechanosensitive channel
MCRPSCCNQGGGQGAGVAAVAIIMVAALVAAKIGPIVAGIVHTALEVLHIVELTTGLVLALAVVTWAVIVITRWQLQRRRILAANPARVAVMRLWEQAESADRPDCLACGGTGTVLRAIDNSRYLPGECPVCEPIRRAG